MFQRISTLLLGIFIGLLASALVLIISSEPRGSPITLLPPPTQSPLRVHVAGAVRAPGVYALAPGSIAQEALEAAGGALPEAELDSINLAAKLSDGMQVYVPEEGEPLPTQAVQTDTERVRLNQASAAELQQLPGIGPVLAEAIIEHRETHGPFPTVDSLLDVAGIGPAKLEAMRDLIELP